MTVGQLSTDQQAYASTLAQLTGLAPSVVTSWIGAETPWGSTSTSHNYLNIGPGRDYASAQQAAQAAASLLNTSSYYTGIKNAVSAGPQAQINAIVASPWDAGHYLVGKGGDPTQSSISKIWHQLFGSSAGSAVAGSTNSSSGSSTSTSSSISATPASLLGDATSSVVSSAAKAAFDVVFLAGGLALIGLGLARLTSVDAGDAVRRGADFAGKATTALALVPK